MTNELGRYYWGVKLNRLRLVYLYADKIEVRDGDLLCFGHMHEDDEEPSERDGTFLFRCFASGTWSEVFAASCLDGTECSEEHDIELKD